MMIHSRQCPSRLRGVSAIRSKLRRRRRSSSVAVTAVIHTLAAEGPGARRGSNRCGKVITCQTKEYQLGYARWPKRRQDGNPGSTLTENMGAVAILFEKTSVDDRPEGLVDEK